MTIPDRTDKPALLRTCGNRPNAGPMARRCDPKARQALEHAVKKIKEWERHD